MLFFTKYKFVIIAIILLIIITAAITWAATNRSVIDRYRYRVVDPDNWQPSSLSLRLKDAILGIDSTFEQEKSFGMFNALPLDNKISVVQYWEDNIKGTTFYYMDIMGLGEELNNEWFLQTEGKLMLKFLRDNNIA